MKIISTFFIGVIFSEFASSLLIVPEEPVESVTERRRYGGHESYELDAATEKFNSNKDLLAEKLNLVKLEAATKQLVAGMNYIFNGTFTDASNNQIWASVSLYEVAWNPSANQMKIVFQKSMGSNQENQVEDENNTEVENDDEETSDQAQDQGEIVCEDE